MKLIANAAAIKSSAGVAPLIHRNICGDRCPLDKESQRPARFSSNIQIQAADSLFVSQGDFAGALRVDCGSEEET